MTDHTNPAAMPAPVVTQEDMNLWYKLQDELSKIKAAELELRKKIFAGKFINPTEGTNTVPLSDGWVLKGQYKIDRKVDEALLVTLEPILKQNKIPVKELINYKPELALRNYRDLSDEQQAIFDQVLVIKVGTPSMEIVKPKR